MTIEESRTLINDLLILIEESQSSARLDFDDPLLTNEDYQSWTGWNKQQFDKMFDYVSNHLRSSFNRTARNAFALFWIKLKTNLSFHQIGSLFHITDDVQTRRKRASDSFESVRKLMAEYFVSKHLGVGHLTRDEAKSHNTAYTKVRIISVLEKIVQGQSN